MPCLIERFRESEVIQLDESGWVALAERYVPDLVAESADTGCTTCCPIRVVLLLESPHTDEVCSGYPLAGTSGSDVAKKLTEWRLLRQAGTGNPDPIGQIVRCGNSHARWLGLMNVSNLPLQDLAYDLRNISPCLELLLCRFGKIRTGVKRDCLPHHRNPITQSVQEVIIDDLADRICQLLRRCTSSPMFVPCGRFAQAFFREVSRRIEENPLGLLDIPEPGFIPHPSRRQWTKQPYQCILEYLASKLGTHLRSN